MITSMRGLGAGGVIVDDAADDDAGTTWATHATLAAAGGEGATAGPPHAVSSETLSGKIQARRPKLPEPDVLEVEDMASEVALLHALTRFGPQQPILKTGAKTGSE